MKSCDVNSGPIYRTVGAMPRSSIRIVCRSFFSATLSASLLPLYPFRTLSSYRRSLPRAAHDFAPDAWLPPPAQRAARHKLRECAPTRTFTGHTAQTAASTQGRKI